jgi:hypothetical protein
MSSKNDSVDNAGLTQSQQQQPDVDSSTGSMTADYSVLGTDSDDSLSYEFPQQTRNRLADRIRRLHQQPPSLEDGVVAATPSTTTMSETNSNDKSELYLQVKQGIVQIKSKEQHT